MSLMIPRYIATFKWIEKAENFRIKWTMIATWQLEVVLQVAVVASLVVPRLFFVGEKKRPGTQCVHICCIPKKSGNMCTFGCLPLTLFVFFRLHVRIVSNDAWVLSSSSSSAATRTSVHTYARSSLTGHASRAQCSMADRYAWTLYTT